MTKNRACQLLFAPILIAACGCGTRRESVYVDVESLVGPDVQAIRASMVTESPPAVETAHIQRSLEPQTLEGRSRKSTEDAQKFLADDRARELKEISIRIKKLYELEADRIAKAKFGDMNPKKLSALRVAEAKIHEAFLAYASQRGPLVAKLALLVGFPDPDRGSARIPAGDLFLANQRFEQAKALRAQIVALDAGYLAQTQKWLKEAQDQIDEDLTQMQLQVQQLKDEADSRAETEATRMAASFQRELGISPTGLNEVRLPAVPGVAYQPHAPGPPPPMSPTTIESLQGDRAVRLKILQSRLRIWIGLKGYVLAARGQGRDATKEFNTWMLSLESGR